MVVKIFEHEQATRPHEYNPTKLSDSLWHHPTRQTRKRTAKRETPRQHKTNARMQPANGLGAASGTKRQI